VPVARREAPTSSELWLTTGLDDVAALFQMTDRERPEGDPRRRGQSGIDLSARHAPVGHSFARRSDDAAADHHAGARCVGDRSAEDDHSISPRRVRVHHRRCWTTAVARVLSDHSGRHWLQGAEVTRRMVLVAAGELLLSRASSPASRTRMDGRRRSRGSGTRTARRHDEENEGPHQPSDG